MKFKEQIGQERERERDGKKVNFDCMLAIAVTRSLHMPGHADLPVELAVQRKRELS